MRFSPHEYQRYGVGRIIADEKLGLFWDMGLGKSVVTLTAINDLKYNRLAVNKVLVIAPKKVAEATWTAEVAKWDHLKLLRVSKVMGTAQQRIRALAAQADIYVINRDNTKWLADYYRNDWPFDMVVCDEFSSFKNSQSKRFKALRNMLPHINRLVGLTGTPAPNGLEDLWAQVYLLDQGKRLGRTLTDYRNAYFSHNPYRHEFKAKAGAEQEVHDAIRDICVSMSAKDYLQMPECITVDVPVALDVAAAKAYQKLERDMLLEIDEDTIEAAGAMALSNKLLQLCSGAAYDAAGAAVRVHDCKIEALSELVEGLNGQRALLFYGFRHDVPRIKAVLSKGDSESGKRSLRIREYQKPEDGDAWNRGEVDILLAHPASCAYGLNLQQGGHHVIWYGLTWSLELYQQANARLHRQGQEHPVIIHRLLVQGGMDEDVAAALEGKRDTQDALMEALKARIERAKKG